MNDAQQDARFADADGEGLRLRALDAEDITVISALVQDAIVTVGDVAWMRPHRRFAALINRFRWEGPTRTPERARSLLVFEGVTAVRAQGVDPGNKDMVLSVLSLAWEPGSDAAGRILVTLAGDGVIAVEVEALEVLLQDVTRPYLAPSRRVPSHPE